MNREQWLTEAAEKMVPLLKSRDLEVPSCIKVSCGFTGCGSRRKTLGGCWVEDAQIYISPITSKPNGDNGVLATLLHELVHACLPKEYNHNKEFKKAAYAVGLEGKPSATTASEGLINGLFSDIINELGEYPHIALEIKEQKKKGSRMRKIECTQCGLITRTTKKWMERLVEAGRTPICWLCGSEMVFENRESE